MCSARRTNENAARNYPTANDIVSEMQGVFKQTVYNLLCILLMPKKLLLITNKVNFISLPLL